MDNLLSERAKVSRDWEDSENGLILCNNNPYDMQSNPCGYINLGTAMNSLCKDMFMPKLNDIWICDFMSLGYKDNKLASMKLRQALAKFMTAFFDSHEPVSPDNLFCFNGVTSCIDLLCHCLANPGEVFLVPTPMYNRNHKNCMQISLVELFPVYVICEDDEDKDSILTIEKIVNAYEIAVKTDHLIRGILLTNPNIPLGDIYSPELLIDIMSFCHAKSLHLIVNEVYAMSVFSQTVKFHSILKFPRILNSDRTHVIYGLSKDFGIPGLRIGAIHTKCKELQKSLINLSYLHGVPYPILKIAAHFLEDRAWCRDFINLYQRRLAEMHKHTANILQDMGIKIRKCEAGIFLWFDLRHLCKSSFKEEKKLFNYLLKEARLYIGRGQDFFCVQPGWFGIAFARDPYHMAAGIERFKVLLQNYNP